MNAAIGSVLRWLCRVAALHAMVLAGCSITGLGGSDQYGCKAPEGVRCESVSGTYANSVQNNLPAQRRSSATHANSAAAGAQPAVQTPTALSGGVEAANPSSSAPEPQQPLRSEPRILRLWFKAYLDSDQDLNDQGYVFVQVDSGRWLIERTQRQAREAFAPIRPPRATSDVSKDPRPTSASASTTASEPFRLGNLPPSASGAVSRGKGEERP